jgi:hypothetical protein
MSQKVCLLPPTPQQVKSATDQLVEELSNRSIPYALTRGVAGALVGNIIDGQIDGNDEGGMPLFTTLGILAGTRTGVRATGVVGSGIKAAVDPIVPRAIKERMEFDKLHRNQEYVDAYGMTIKGSDTEAVTGFRNSMNAVQLGLSQGRDAVGSLFDSPWIKSQFSTLRAFAKNAPVANKMINFLRAVPDQIKQMKSDVQMQYNAVKGANAYENFVGTQGIQAAKEALDAVARRAGLDTSRMSVNQLRLELDEAIHRILDSGMGGPQSTPRAGVLDSYGSKPWAQSFDEELMKNNEVVEFVQATRAFYEKVNNEANAQYIRTINRAMDELHVIFNNSESPDPSQYLSIYRKNMMSVLSDYRASKMPWKQFVSSLDDEGQRKVAELTQAINSDKSDSRILLLFNRVRKLQTNIQNQEKLSNAYIPHIEDKRKMTSLKESLIRQGKVKADGDVRPEMKDVPDFDTYVERRYFEVNYGNDRKLYSYDDDSLEFNTKHYSSQNKASEQYEALLTRARNNGEIDAQQYAIGLSRKSDFIKEGKRTTSSGETVKMFYLEAPENLPPGFPADFFQKHNQKVFKQFSNQYRGTNFDVKKSSRLDYQRRLDMPYEFRQTDIYQVNTSYANDVAPRLHSLRNDIYDVSDFKQNLVAPMVKQLGSSQESVYATQVGETMAGIYNTSMRITQFQEARDVRAFERMARVSNVFRNLMATAYQYGIGFYNIFEHAVQTPTLTSWNAYGKTMKLFATNRRAANAMADTIVDMKVIDTQLKGQSGNTELIDDLGGLTSAERMLERSAEWSANFSITKFLGKGVGIDVEKGGLARLAFDGFMGGNIMSTAINAHASLTELRKLTEVYQALKQIPEGQPQVVQMHGRRYNIGTVERKLSDLGIDKTNIKGYMDPKTQAFLKDFLENIEAGKTLTADQITQNSTALKYLQTVMNTTTENYQATNQLYRPERAMTPGGRLLYQYSTYSYNQILQNLQRRIRFPIQDWTSQVPEQMSKTTSVVNFLYKYNTGDFEGIKKMGKAANMTDAQIDNMINNFPADAYNHMVKYFGAAVGISVLGNTSIDAFRDFVANPFKEDDEQWSRLNRRAIVNPLAPKGEQRTFGEVIQDIGGDDMYHLGQYFAAMYVDTGLFGRADIFYSSYGKQSLMDLTPVTRAANDVYRDMMKVRAGGVTELSETLPDVAIRNTLRYLPFVGSSPFSELRGTVQKKILDDPRAATVRMDGAPILPQNILPFQ